LVLPGTSAWLRRGGNVVTTKSRKAKGRSLQQTIRNSLREIGVQYGLVDDDIESRGMGQNGVDIILTPAAKKVFGDLAIEAKNHQQINLTSTFWQHAPRYPKAVNLLVSKKNRTLPLVTMTLSDYLDMLRKLLAYKSLTGGVSGQAPNTPSEAE
jgi:hypothetical protein